MKKSIRSLEEGISVNVTDNAQHNIIIVGDHNNIDLRALVEDTDAAGKADTIFISHTQNDKNFTLWLSLQLISQGYLVWCDLINPEPGHNANELAKQTLQNKTIKFLYVLTNKSNQNAESLKELKAAYDVMKNIDGLIIALQVEPIPTNDLNILLQELKPIDFSNGWARGLSNLLDYFEKNNIPKYPELNNQTVKDIWRNQFSADKGVEFKSEELLSNWFPIDLPEFIYFHELKRSGIGPLEIVESNLPFAGFQHNIYLVSFAPEDNFNGRLGAGLSIKNTSSVSILDLLSGDYNQKLINKDLAWKVVSRLLNDAWERFFSQSKNMGIYRLANNQPCYYFKAKFSDKSDNKSFFTGVNGLRTWRSLVGSRKGKIWHFGIQGKVSLHPQPLYIVKTHILFSDDGQNIWTSKEKLHSSRRSLCKNWWNADWRDKLLASIAFFSNSEGFLQIPIANNLVLSIPAAPLLFSIPVSYLSVYDRVDIDEDEEDDAQSLEEDDLEYDEFDEEEIE